MHHVASDIEEEVGNKKKNNKREFDVDEEVGNKEKTRRQKESSPRGVAATAEAVKDPTSDDKEDSFDDLNTTEPGQATSESELDSHFQKNSPKKQHKTTVDSVTCDTSKSSKSYKSDPSYTSEKKAVDSSSSQSATSSKRKKFSLWESMKRRKWHCLCCITLLLFLVVVAIVGFVVLSAYQESKDASNESSYAIVETDIPSMYPSMAPTQQMTHNSSDAPSTTPSEQVFAGGLQIGGVDPNEYCNKPCPEGEDCGRCAWCNADRGNYTFTILDSDGNGLCCNEGVGFYSINANDGQLIFGEGQFGYLHNETFSVGYLHTEEMTATSKSAPMLRGRGQGQKSSSYHPNRQRKHAQSIESES